MIDLSKFRCGREPAVAGSFYPREPRQIKATIDGWVGSARSAQQVWRAALVPHAGWVYSGRVAADVLSRIVIPQTVVVLCPRHYPGNVECAVAPWTRWNVPGGGIDVDSELSAELVAQISGWEFDDRPHRQEHAIEVLLPLLANQAPQCRIVGVTVGRLRLDECHDMATSLAEVIGPRLGTLLLLISSDMNHFATDDENRRLDELALMALDDLDPDRLYDTCRRNQISMCGMLPAVMVLSALRQLNALHQAERVAYATSAEVSGDQRRVVGYAGMLFR